MLTLEQRKEKAVIDIINKQFQIAGLEVTYWDIEKEQNWVWKYTMTKEQNDRWKDWCKLYLKNHFKKWDDYKIKSEISMIDMNWGLKIKD
jgi:hypothetical protein